MSIRDVYIVDAVRTPIGKFGGALAGVRPDDLAAHVVRALVDRTPDLDPARIDDVVFGDANGAGEDNRDVARMAVLLAGLPGHRPRRHRQPALRLRPGGRHPGRPRHRARRRLVAIAGGVESMSRAPWVLQKPERAFPAGHQQLYSTTLGWRMTNPRMPAEWTGRARRGRRTHRRQARHHPRAAGRLRPRQPPQGRRAPGPTGCTTARSSRTTGGPAARRVHPRLHVPGGARQAEAGLPHGRTARSRRATPRRSTTAPPPCCSSTRRGCAATGREPLARIRASAVTGIEPQLFGLGPVEAVQRALAKAGRTFADLTTFELNEAFAAQALGCLAEWPELDPAVVNPRGGAIAIGHPLGASGARLAGSVAHQLAAAGSGTGLAALCIGVGQGIALVLER